EPGPAPPRAAGAGYGLDGLGLLPLAAVGPPRPAHVTAAAGVGAVAIDIGVRGAARGVLPERGEVVQDVEVRDPQVAAHLVGRVLASVHEVHTVAVVRYPRGGGVQPPVA